MFSALRPLLSSCLAAAALSVLTLGTGSALSQTPMGTEVVNTAHVTWQVDGVDQGAGLFPEARFMVARAPSAGVLTAWQLDKGLTSGPFEDILFPAGDYLNNNFVALPEPVDTSTLTGDPTPVDRSNALRVFQTDHVRLGVPIFFTLEDAGLNLDPTQVETVIVTLSDALTGDTEELRFYETGPDTGVFSAWINTTDAPAVSGDGQLSTQDTSVITVQYQEAANPLNDRDITVDVIGEPINQYGLVFDSLSGTPLNGIELTLIDMATGQPADVVGEDMVSVYPSTLVSGGQVIDSSGRVYEFQSGEYRFPYVAPGSYRIAITQSESDTHAAPSQREDADIQTIPGAPFVLVAGSRLDPFDVESGTPWRIDIPMDAQVMAQITRTASHSEATIGEFLEYTVTVTPSDSGTLTILDGLPNGIVFLPGTLLVDGRRVTPQLVDGGRRLSYELPARPAGQAITITYGAQVVPPTRTGRVLSSFSEVVTAGMRRLRADHVLRVRDALGLDQVAILGQISAGGCGPDTSGYDLSGIRVLLENGEYAITDSGGRFTFRDIYRRPRVVQMDVTTLPPGARPVLCYASTRSAGSAISQFVDLRPGMMGRVEFYLEFDEKEDVDTVEPAASSGAERSAFLRFDQNWLDRHAARHGPGFLAPVNGHLPRSEAIDVVYLRPIGARSELWVNEETVPAIRREPTIRSSDGRWELVRYRAVRIGEGRNALSLVITDSNGQMMLRQTHDVLYGLRPAQLDLLRATSVLESDGRSQPQIMMRLTDRAGIPIRPGTQVTVMVESPFGFAPTGPVRRSSPASERVPRSRIAATVQDDGLISVTLAPVLEGGTARISIPATGRELNLRVPISAANRPWVLVGLAEGTLAHARVRQHMRREDEIGNALSGRVALFAEGVVRGEWLLTLRYDSAQDRDAFYGIDPDADYIVYGDRSTQGNAAQSRFPMYLRLRREGAEFLIGDFNTNLNAGGISINQQVTGARAVFEDEHWRVMTFVAPLSNRLVEDRIALNGTVGPYQLSQSDIIPHSHTIRLVTVSRSDASEELDSRTLVAGLDYIVSYTTGRVFLRRPIPAFTPELHRNILVADYEVDQDLRNSLIAGIRVEAEPSPYLRVGATAVHARRVEGQDLSITLGGFDLSYQATDALTLSADVLFARRNFATYTDTGLRTELRAEFEDERTHIAAYLRRQRGHVALTASDRSIDTTIAGLRLRHQLWADPDTPSERWLLDAQLQAEDDRANATRRHDGEVLLTRERDYKSQSVGFRGLSTTDAQGQTRDIRLVYRGTGTSEDGRLTQALGTEVSLRPDGVRAGDKLDMSFGYELSDRWTVFGTFEVESQRQTGIEARRFTFGAEFSPKQGRSYRTALSWAGNGHHNGQALFVGADHDYTLRDGLTAYLGGDMQWDLGAAGVPMGQSIGSPYIAESFVAMRAGLRREEESWGAGLDAEWRGTRSTHTANLRFRMDGELSESWSAGAEAFLGLTQNSGESWRNELKVQASAAHRAGPRDPITLLQGELRQRDQGGIESLTAIASVYHSRYLSDTEFLNLRYGLKYDQANLRTGKVNDVLNLIGAEFRRDITDNLDIGLHGSAMQAARTGRMSSSLGLSMGLTPFDNGWLSLGYNFNGFHDPDFSALGHTDAGPFVQFRMKFDADSLRGMFR